MKMDLEVTEEQVCLKKDAPEGSDEDRVAAIGLQVFIDSMPFPINPRGSKKSRKPTD